MLDGSAAAWEQIQDINVAQLVSNHALVCILQMTRQVKQSARLCRSTRLSVIMREAGIYLRKHGCLILIHAGYGQQLHAFRGCD